MYQLYGTIDGTKVNDLFDTLAETYSEIDAMADQLRSATSFSLYIVNPEGTQTQEFTK